MADFELLGVYVSIRTRGLATVLRDFSRVRAAAQQINRPFGDRALDQGVARIGRMLRDVQQMNNAVNRGVRSWERMNEAIGRALSNRAIRNGIAAFDQMVRSIRQSNRAINQGVAAWERMGRAIERQRQQMRQAINSITLEAGFIAPFTRIGGNITRIAGSFREVARSAGFGTSAVRAFGVAGVAFGVALKAIQTTLNLLGSAIRTLARIALPALREAFQLLLGPTLAFLRVVRLLVQNLPFLAAAIGGALTRSVIRTAAEFQRLTSLFQFAFGTQAQQQLQFVINLSRQLGVPLDAIAENYARITAAARDSGIAQQELQTLFTGTSAAAVALGLDTERVNGLFFAFDQIISKGRLSAEELRRQIGDRLPGAFDIAAKAMGVTTEALDDMLKQGQVTARQFIGLFGRELVDRFFEQALAQATRINSALGLLRTEIFLAKGAFATLLEPALVRVVNRLTLLIRRISESAPFRRFALFVAIQLQTIENHFDRITGAIARLAQRWQPTFERLGRIIVVVNTVAIGGMIELFNRLQSRIEVVIFRMETFVRSLTGINIRGLGLNLNTIIAIAEAIPQIFDAISLRIQLTLERVRQFIGALGRAMVDSGSLIAREVGKLFTGIAQGAEQAMTSFSEETIRSRQLSEELRKTWESIGVTIQKSLDSTLAGRFARSVEAAQASMVGMVTTAFRDLQLIAASPPSLATIQVREALEVAATAANQPVQVFPSNELTRIEQGIQLTALTLKRIEDGLGNVARESLTSVLLRLAGGGLSR